MPKKKSPKSEPPTVGPVLIEEDDPSSVETWSSGSAVLDSVVGRGWARGRMINVVGSSATGKTLLIIEAMTTFLRAYPDAVLKHRDIEGAFDPWFARHLGCPVDAIDVDNPRTIEAVTKELQALVDKPLGRPVFYGIDSLDALATEKELKPDKSGGPGYGTEKAKKVSELLRRVAGSLPKADVTLFTISQERENLGLGFKDKVRSGGTAIQFYSSQVVWLSLRKQLSVTRGGVKRALGVISRAYCDKTRTGPPYREAMLPIFFGYGAEDVLGMLLYLHSVGELGRAGISPPKSAKTAASKADEKQQRDDAIGFLVQRITSLHNQGMAAIAAERARIEPVYREVYREVESRFAPAGGKYA